MPAFRVYPTSCGRSELVESDPYQTCSHLDFDYKGILLQVTYGKYFLPQWKAIEQTTKGLFDSFAAYAE
jgi:hypothetical protein